MYPNGRKEMNDGSVGLVVEGLLKVRELHRSYNNEAAVKSLNQAYQIRQPPPRYFNTIGTDGCI